MSRTPARAAILGPRYRLRLGAGVSCCLCRDAMSLSGLLRVIADDPQLSRALELAGQPVAGGADLIAPPALRAVLAAALTGADAGPAGAGPADAGPADA